MHKVSSSRTTAWVLELQLLRLDGLVVEDHGPDMTTPRQDLGVLWPGSRTN
jgi:hypothetical protein